MILVVLGRVVCQVRHASRWSGVYEYGLIGLTIVKSIWKVRMSVQINVLMENICEMTPAARNY